MLCVFDCETIPDVELLRLQMGLEGSDLEVCEKAFKIQEEKSGSSFLPYPFHKIVSIAAVIADDYGRFIKVGGFAQEGSEKEILGAFLDYLNAKQPKLVSFNGRGFDLPMLLLRAMKYNLSAYAYFESDNPALNKNKWENYRQRYSERFHVDLYDTLGHYGAGRSMRLDLVCAMSGLPGKFDVHGDEVYRLYFEGKRREIDEYCQSDVLNTYWLYLKYELLAGNLTLEDYYATLAEFMHKIPQGRSYSEIFLQYAQKEIDAKES